MSFLRIIVALSAVVAMVAGFTMPKSFLHKAVKSQGN